LRRTSWTYHYDQRMAEQEWHGASQRELSSPPLRLPATPPSASHSASSPPSSYSRLNYSGSVHPVSPYTWHTGMHQRPLPPLSQSYTTPPSRTLPPMHTHPPHHMYSHLGPPPQALPQAGPPTPGEPPWDARQDIYRLDEHSLRRKLLEAIHTIQQLEKSLSTSHAALAESSFWNSLLRTESREISQRSAVETELAKREVEVLFREYVAQMPSANQLANTYYRRYRGLKRRVKDLEGVIEVKEAEIRRLQEYVRDQGILVPKEGAKRTRRTGLKYAPRGGAFAAKMRSPTVQRTLKPAPATKPDENSQESQSSGLDALGMLASQVLDSQEYPSQPRPKTLLSPLSIPTKRARTHSPESMQHSPVKVPVHSDDERIRESPPGQSLQQPSYPLPYRADINGGPRRKLNFDSHESDILNHDV
jgi:hypothetical protein